MGFTMSLGSLTFNQTGFIFASQNFWYLHHPQALRKYRTEIINKNSQYQDFRNCQKYCQTKLRKIEISAGIY
jgi:hypothetical protein